MTLFTLVAVLFFFIWLTNEIYFRFWQKNLTLSIFFSSATAFEGDKLRLTEILTNRKILPLPWAAVKFQVSKHLLFDGQSNFNISDDYYKNDLFSIMSYQKITRNLDFVCGKRGFYKIKSAELLSQNPLFTEKLVSHVESAAYLTVYPKLIDLDGINFDSMRITGDVISRRFINPDPFEFRGIREYNPSDDFKAINFSATAKLGELMVNMYEFAVSREVVIFLNFERYASWVDRQLFEKTISLAASLAKLYIEEAVPVKIISGSPDVIDKNTTDTGSGSSYPHLLNIYNALARLDLEDEAQPIIDFLPVPVFSANENKTHILLSTYRDEALERRFNELRAGFSNIFWLLPYTAGMKLEGIDDDKIITWEVSHDFTAKAFSQCGL